MQVRLCFQVTHAPLPFGDLVPEAVVGDVVVSEAEGEAGHIPMNSNNSKNKVSNIAIWMYCALFVIIGHHTTCSIFETSLLFTADPAVI